MSSRENAVAYYVVSTRKSLRYRYHVSLFLLQYISNESEIADSVIRFNMSFENGLERLLRQNNLVSEIKPNVETSIIVLLFISRLE